MDEKLRDMRQDGRVFRLHHPQVDLFQRAQAVLTGVQVPPQNDKHDLLRCVHNRSHSAFSLLIRIRHLAQLHPSQT